jgi:protoporphyrinogen oxidase
LILVAGAGPAGLSAAYHLRNEQLTVIEREREPGGLCRSFDIAGTTFDLGGHAFFTKHPYVREMLEGLGAKLYFQPRHAFVFTHGRFIPYPFQANLYGLPEDVIADCLDGVREAASEYDPDFQSPNLQEWIMRSFGWGISQHFLAPYNAKVWAHPLTDVAPDWTSQRVLMPKVAEIEAGASRQVRIRNYPNAIVGYPESGGFAELFSGLAESVAPVIKQGEVTGLSLGERIARTAAGDEIPFDSMISTIPLTELIDRTADAADCCRAAARTLRHNSLYLVNFVIGRQGVSAMHRIYSADPGVPFHKLALNSTSSPSLGARATSAIQAEISYSETKHVDLEGLSERAWESLVAMGLVAPEEQVLATSVVTVPFAYPIMTRETAVAREHLLTTLERSRVLCAGRFGEWLYINSDDAIMRGKARAEQLSSQSGNGR